LNTFGKRDRKTKGGQKGGDSGEEVALGNWDSELVCPAVWYTDQVGNFRGRLDYSGK
jgi:hypothetical protein